MWDPASFTLHLGFARGWVVTWIAPWLSAQGAEGDAGPLRLSDCADREGPARRPALANLSALGERQRWRLLQTGPNLATPYSRWEQSRVRPRLLQNFVAEPFAPVSIAGSPRPELPALRSPGDLAGGGRNRTREGGVARAAGDPRLGWKRREARTRPRSSLAFVCLDFHLGS